MHRDDFQSADGAHRRWAWDGGDHAGDALAAFSRHEQVRREAMIARECAGARAPILHSLVAWVHHLRSSADPAAGGLGSGEARVPRRPLRTLIDRLRGVVFPGRTARV